MITTKQQSFDSPTDAEIARNLLDSHGLTCVLCKNDAVHTTTLRGVKPLMQWLENGTDLTGFSAADKVVGRATAFLYCLLGVKEVYAYVMSKSALEVLEAAGIYAQYGKLVEYIINRKGDGICPFEAAVLDIQTAESARIAIRKKMEELKISL